MAKVTQLIDDTDGSIATQTITFGAFGKEYEIDLNDTNASAFLADLTHFATAGREVVRERPIIVRGGKTRTKKTVPAGSTSELREWARQNGWPDLGDRGRVAADIVKAFNERPQGPQTVIGEDNMADVVAEITGDSDTNGSVTTVETSAPKPGKSAPLPKVPRARLPKVSNPAVSPFEIPNPADTALLHG